MSIEGGIVGSGGAAGCAALAPVDRELPLAALVDEIRGERADRGCIALAIGIHELLLVAIAATADGADEIRGEKAPERSSVKAGP